MTDGRWPAVLPGVAPLRMPGGTCSDWFFIDMRFNYLTFRAGIGLIAFFMLVIGWAAGAHAATGSYEAGLPAELNTANNMCALVPCADVFPGARSFSERMGQPPYVEAYSELQGDKKKLLG